MNREAFDSKSDNELHELSRGKDDDEARKSKLFEISPFIDKSSNLDGARDPEKSTSASPTCTENLSLYFSQFCGATSIHGIQFVGERGRFVAEKIIWTIILTILGSMCIHLILKAYDKWVTSPVIVTFSTTETPIWDIPFPAVTVCPEVKSNPTKFNFTDVVLKKLFDDELTDYEKKYVDIFALICDGASVMDMNEEENYYLNDTVSEDLDELFPEIDPLNITTIKWLGKQLNVADSLSYTITNEGLCFTFNMLDYDEILKFPDEYIDKTNKDVKSRKWSLEGGYPADSVAFDSFPRRTFIAGLDGGLIIDSLYTNHSNLDYLCQDSLQGFKVTLHHPSELPNMDNYFRLALDEAVTVGIKPRMITVSENLLSYSPESRKCYFSNEKQLALFNSYSQRNCLTECLVNFTLASCNCVPFYMPEYEDTKYCGPAKDDCVSKSRVQYFLNETNTENKVCNCLPSCTSLEYDVEITQTAWNWRESIGVLHRLGLRDLVSEYDNTHLSRLVVFYKDMQFLTSERNELYGYVDFFSNTGGLLGLFVGFSVTSAIEILYFLTLRLACNIKKYGKKVWSGDPELLNAEDKEN